MRQDGIPGIDPRALLPPAALVEHLRQHAEANPWTGESEDELQDAYYIARCLTLPGMVISLCVTLDVGDYVEARSAGEASRALHFSCTLPFNDGVLRAPPQGEVTAWARMVFGEDYRFVYCEPLGEPPGVVNLRVFRDDNGQAVLLEGVFGEHGLVAWDREE